MGRYLCNTRAHATPGCLADVIVTFGELGTKWHRDALWQDSWGRSYPMCMQCWEDTRQTAINHRPALMIRDTTQPPAGPPAHGSPAAPSQPG